MALEPGTRLGPYEIVELRGKGGMGEVYRARDTRLDRDVAVKVLPAELSEDETYRKRLEREAKTISQLQHNHVCRLYDIGSDGDTQYLVMEYLEGETLEDRLHGGALPVDNVLKIGREIAEAVDAAHRKGVVHRDLKPGNVMLTEGGVKVLDFGLAREFVSQGDVVNTQAATVPAITGEGTLVGTMPYMAPEQLQGSKADARTDIWALGCILYEMATGDRPFSGETQASLIGAILKDDPEPPTRKQPMAPERLDWLVKRCLAKDPDERWQSAKDLAIELSGLGVPAVDPPPEAESRRSRLRPWILAVSVGLALTVSLVWITRERDPDGAGEAVSGGDTSELPAMSEQTLAVLPFENFAADPDLDQLARGLPAEILTRIQDVIPTVARSTSFAAVGAEVCAAAADMAARFVLEGSLQRQGDRLRVSAQLVECPGGHHPWAETYERPGTDLFGAQDELSREIAAAVWHAIYLGSTGPGTAMWHHDQSTPEDSVIALHLFEEAARREPTNATWLAMVFYARRTGLFEGWEDPSAELYDELRAALDRCVAADSTNFTCYQAQGHYYSSLGQREEAIASFKRSVELSGDQPAIYAWLGLALAIAGESDRAIEILQNSIDKVPEGWSYWRGAIARAHFAERRYGKALEWTKEAIRIDGPEVNADSYELLAAIYGQLGREEEAREALETAQRLRPGTSIQRSARFYSIAEPEHRGRYLDGLRMAGLEE